MEPRRVLQNQNVTQGEKAEFYCEADPKTEPTPQIDFMINAQKLDGKCLARSVLRVQRKRCIGAREKTFCVPIGMLFVETVL